MSAVGSDHTSLSSQRLVSWAGIIFVYISAAGFLFVGLMAYLKRDIPPPPLAGIAPYPEIIISVLAVFTAFLGVSLLRAAGIASIAPGPVANADEWGVLSSNVAAANEGAITQYVRLRSLTGFSGVFTKLGVQGLPLATIALTLFFSIMFFYGPEFLDLAKLTLGAFIGSFVQKQIGERQGGGEVELPSGEKLSIRRTPPPVA